MNKSLATLVFMLLAASPASAQFDKVLKGLGSNIPSLGGSALSDAKIGSGLQEALKVGTENAVGQTGAVDGFLMNKAIKILMPKTCRISRNRCAWSVTGRKSTSSSSA